MKKIDSSETPSKKSLSDSVEKFSDKKSTPHSSDAKYSSHPLVTTKSSPDSKIKNFKSNLNLGGSESVYELQKEEPKSVTKTESTVNRERKNIDFHALFKELPLDDVLVTDYSCAINKGSLHHGRLYISTKSVSFYSNIFGWITNISIKYNDIAKIQKQKTAKVIPNAIELETIETEKYFFTSFLYRDEAVDILNNLWRKSLSKNIKQGSTNNDISDDEGVMFSPFEPDEESSSKAQSVNPETYELEDISKTDIKNLVNESNILAQNHVSEKFNVLIYKYCSEQFHKKILEAEKCKDIEVSNFDDIIKDLGKLKIRHIKYNRAIRLYPLGESCLIYIEMTFKEELSCNANRAKFIQTYRNLENEIYCTVEIDIENEAAQKCFVTISFDTKPPCKKHNEQKDHICYYKLINCSIEHHLRNCMKELMNEKDHKPKIFRVGFFHATTDMKKDCILKISRNIFNLVNINTFMKYMALIILLLSLYFLNAYTSRQIRNLQEKLHSS